MANTDYISKYYEWLNNEELDENTKKELREIKDNDSEIKERFYYDLDFGTAGLRGIMGAGTNRMNIYTVRQATQGLAEYVKAAHGESRGVVIAYDSRNNSKLFALEAAKVLTANGIKTYLFDELRPTPELSFAVRELGCISGIVITASHNPPEYNGYKVYGEDGGQLSPEAASVVIEQIKKIHVFSGVKTMDDKEAESKGLLVYIGEEVDKRYLSEVLKQRINEDVPRRAKDFKIVYTPFHGTGNKPVQKILQMIGMKNVYVVKEQQTPDGNFPTVKSPNPEYKEGFALAIELAKKENIDLIIGTDPDCDRVGVIVRDSEGDYIPLTGNQVGCLLTEYVLSQRKLKGTLPKNPFIVKTVVTSEMVRAIAKEYNVEVVEVLTGFKFIAEKIKEAEDEGGKRNFVFGFEESYGYLSGTYVRDKDAVVASMLIAEMAAWYSLKDMNLFDAILKLYEKYGTYAEGIKNIYEEGVDGIAKIKSMMKNIRKNSPKALAGMKVTAYRDYLINTRTDAETGEKTPLNLPESDVFYFEIGDTAWAALRPSGTEPKLKIYCGVRDDDCDRALETANRIIDEINSELNK